jgi:DNA-binding NarL/FixJ family response regulator
MSDLRIRALVVEDDRSWQQILKEILTDLGLVVDVADNLEMALNSMRLFPHRLAVVDLSLRGENPHNQDGLRVLEAIRAKDPGCAAILLTGFATVELAVSVLTGYGAFTCLQKELFQRSQFVRLASEALASHPPLEERLPAGKVSLAGASQGLKSLQFEGSMALVVEDDAGWRAILSELLQDLGFQVELCSGFGEAVGTLKRRKFHLAVVDLSLSGQAQWETQPENQDLEGYRLLEFANQNGLPAIVVSGVAGPAEIEQVYREKGVFAYLEKQTFDRKVFRRLVAESQVRPAQKGAGGLTEREHEVLNLLALGLTNKEIAERLVITTNTVKRHIKAIFTKMEVHTRSAAVSKVVR